MTSHNSRQRPGTGPSLSPADHCRTRHQRGISAQCGDQAGRVYRFAGDSAFRRPFLALPSRMLDDRIRAGEHQARVTVVEAHEVGRFAARSADLDDLARPLWMAHDVAVHVEPLPEDCLHAPTSSSAFPGGSSAPGALPGRQRRAPGLPRLPRPASTPAPVDGTGHAVSARPAGTFFGFRDSSLFAVEMAMARPRSSLALISAPNITPTGMR